MRCKSLFIRLYGTFNPAKSGLNTSKYSQNTAFCRLKYDKKRFCALKPSILGLLALKKVILVLKFDPIARVLAIFVLNSATLLTNC